ncbi:VpsF family polysaccharide biosynthesis protein [Gilvimarinus sp. F26214L]|uniref:VpsF family polysaccharide biosynthesis protein n=1 Tax=Gilvimarinus sp. DZF01 TaxID=3461371 RepID=UPI0040455E18
MNSRSGLSVSLSTFCYGLLAISVSMRLTLGSSLLDNYFPYSFEGGVPLVKVHPGTWFLLFGVLLIITTRGPSRFCSDVFFKNRSIGLTLTILTVVLLYSVASWGVGGIAVLVDNYFYSILCVYLAMHLKDRHAYRLTFFIIFIILVNCLIAVVEYISRRHLIPNPVTGTVFFRANALMAHPLNNALIALPVGLSALLLPVRSGYRYLISGIVFLALLAFAARASLAVYCFFSAIIIWTLGFHKRRSSRSFFGYLFFASLLSMAFLVLVYFVTFYTSYGGGISSRLQFDDSAYTRIESLLFFARLDLSSYFFGSGPAGFRYLTERYSDAKIIENFWIQMIGIYGVPVFFLMCYGFARVFKGLLSDSSLQVKMVFVSFFLAASSNNSLIVKTPALAVIMLIIVLINKVARRPCHTKHSRRRMRERADEAGGQPVML